MLSSNEQKYVISQFPKNMKLCYENFHHNKVNVITGDIYLAIPYGKKCFAWFTIYNGLEVCFVLELNASGQISHVKIYNCVFHPDLVFGTIVFGTIFHKELIGTFFTVEDIFWYKGVDIGGLDWSTKWRYMDVFFKDIQPIGYNKHFIVFGLPLMGTIDDFREKIKTVPYNIYRIQARNYANVGYAESQKLQDFLKEPLNPKPNPCQNICDLPKEPLKLLKEPKESLKEPTKLLKEPTKLLKEPKEPLKEPKESLKEPKEPLKEPIKGFKELGKHPLVLFEVRPDIQTDIYHLYCSESHFSSKLIYYDIALIPDMATSVKLNKLFRNIKENENMDFMEESDSEEEFEDNREDKYVFLERKFNMYCKFHSKFKKWIPIELASNHEHDLTKISVFSDVKKYR